MRIIEGLWITNWWRVSVLLLRKKGKNAKKAVLRIRK
jgi:hypothetical protein